MYAILSDPRRHEAPAASLGRLRRGRAVLR